MKKLIFVISTILLLTSCSKKTEEVTTKELTFVCKGKISEYFPNQGLSWSDSHSEIKDEVGVVIKGNKLSIKSGKSIFKIPTMYSKNANTDMGWDFDICSIKNHEITFNNYSCDYKIFEEPKFNMLKSIIEIYDGSFDGVTKTLNISMKPLSTIDKISNKEPYQTQNGVYSCVETKPSF